ncbi:hypothetical protein SAMN05216489_06577 [Streptomyces sp. 3213]|uniref:hypothetical protein n=1 Tax=Streptomyces sp. 3213.3 TaxID=1855348 RepID=UPI000896E62F|nr:hypothetical protein [Streptomyces sp. 3213.3]SEE42799.1 hypothetical protein SAMN05216489_06577 [Streptomyces sp. 3213] [Streptomyces sp. 3213.3]
MSRETDTPSSGPDGRGGAAYPSGTPPYGTPAASDDRTDAGRSAAQPEERKTETTLTTRIRINIPGSRPIPPVVVRTPVADAESADGSTTAEAQLPSSALPTGVVEPTAELALPTPEEKTSDWFAPRKSGPAKGGQGGGGTNGAGIPGGSAAGTPSAGTPTAGAPGAARPTGGRPGGVVGAMGLPSASRPGGANGGTNGAGFAGATGGGPVAPGHGGGTGSFDVTEALAAGSMGNGSRPGGGPGEPRRDELPYFSGNGHGEQGGLPGANGQGGFPGPDGQGAQGGYPGSNGQGGFPGTNGQGARIEQFPGPDGQGMGPGAPGGPGGPSGFNGPNGHGGQGGPQGPAGPTGGPVTGDGLMLPPGPMGGAPGAPSALSGYADGPGGQGGPGAAGGPGGPGGLAGPGAPGAPGGAASGRHGARGRGPGGPGGSGGPGAGPGGPGMGPGGPGAGPAMGLGGPGTAGGASLPGTIPGGGLSDDTAILTPQKLAQPGMPGYGAPADQVSGHTVTSGMPVVPGGGTAPFGTGTHPDGPLPHTPPKLPDPGSGQSAPAAKNAGKGAAKKKKKGRSKLVLLGVGVIVIGGGAYCAGLLMNRTDVPKGTTVLGVDIGGGTRDDAVKKLDDAFGDRVNKPLKLSVGGKTVSLKPDQAGLQFDFASTVSKAATSDYNPVSVIGSLFGKERIVQPDMPTDEEKLQAALANLGGGSGAGAVTEGTIEFKSGKAVAVYGKAGKAIDPAASVTAVEDAYRTEVETNTATTVTVPTTTKQPTVDNAEVDREMKAFAEPAMSGLATVKTDTGLSLQLSPKNSLWKFLRVKAVNGKLTDSPDLAALKDLYGGLFDGVKITRATGQKTAVTPQEVYIALRQALISRTDRVGIIDTTPS